MSTLLADFHFLRPWWLLALLPTLLLALRCVRSGSRPSAWSQAIDPVLLGALLREGGSSGSRVALGLLGLGWTVAVLGLAGPAWERLPEPVHRRGDALVVALDLSLSMQSQDLAPSRLARARFKLKDLLATRRDAYTALLAWAGDAHVVTPLSDDVATIEAMLPVLEPGIMPEPGSDPVAAVARARELLDGAGMANGRILLVADALTPGQGQRIGELLSGSGIGLSVLAVGTREGAPIPLPGGGFARDPSGAILVPGLDAGGMAEATREAGGRFAVLALDDADLKSLLPAGAEAEAEAAASERVFERWRDRTPWLALLLLPLAAAGFRRGWLLTLVLATMLPAPRAQALDWESLWSRPDQRGARALANGDAARAAQLFEDPRWRGSAAYEAADWQAAVEAFGVASGADGHYNRGNALARAGRLEEALAAYDAALAESPGMEDAIANRELVEQLLENQQQSPPPQDSPSQGKDGEQDPSRSPGSGEPQGESPGQPAGDDAARDDAAGTPDDEGAGANTTGDAASAAAGEPGQPSDAASTAAGEPREPADAAPAAEGADDGEAGQALEQWLRQVPDDPGALLRRKFEYESARRAAGEAGGDR
ncbi:MAG: vWA domain-containing protein [Gammaproteobacteria bacterium]